MQVDLPAAAQLLAEKREADAGEVAATAGQGDHYVGIIICHLELLQGLRADHRLVRHHVVEHAP